MRAVVIHEHGGRDKLILDDVPDPVPAAGEILLRVKAVGLNYLDIFVRRGMPGACQLTCRAYPEATSRERSLRSVRVLHLSK